jgi:hypothetical protein
MPQRFAQQPDLFTVRPDKETGSLVDQLDEHPGEEFIDRIRGELHATLELARNATTFPWPDLTRTYGVEMRFNSISNWLPRAEAVALRRAFSAEMDRLYEAAGEMRPAVPGADFGS